MLNIRSRKIMFSQRKTTNIINKIMSYRRLDADSVHYIVGIKIELNKPKI